MGPNGETMSDPERDVVSNPPPSAPHPTRGPPIPAPPPEPPITPLFPQLVLNHVLGDMDLFVGRLRGSDGSSKTPKKKKKKKKKNKRGGGGTAQGAMGVWGPPQCHCFCLPPPRSPLQGRVCGLLPEGEIRLQPPGTSGGEGGAQRPPPKTLWAHSPPTHPQSPHPTHGHRGGPGNVGRGLHEPTLFFPPPTGVQLAAHPEPLRTRTAGSHLPDPDLCERPRDPHKPTPNLWGRP